ncbi:MAG: mandelate racemase [Bryobacterales bacterium]|nr:mandelate racemase [Bryobacterales bacterium]
MRRRDALTLLAAVPLFGKPAKALIRGVEILRVQGRREATPGVDAQYQVQPNHVYAELRPKVYRDNPNPQKTTVNASALYLRITTDAGMEGLYGPIDTEAAIVVAQQLRPFLLGKDALAGETLWDQLYRLNRHSSRGHFMMGISAVDNTLWDLRGRYHEVPVYRLLGGPTRTEVEAYGSCLGFSVEPEAAAKKSAELKAQGFRHQKWFIAYGPGDGMEGMAKNLELARVLRESMGPEGEFMFDAFMGWDLNYAVRWAKQAEQYRPRWIEEAFALEKIESYATLRRSTSIPVATGEHFYSRWHAHEYLKAGAISVVQADPEWCGGVSELVKICSLASLFDAHVIPHGHSLHTALHVVASQSPMTCPLVEYLITKMRSYHHFEKDELKPVNGKFALPTRPGFGITLDPAKVEKQAVVTVQLAG